MRNAAKKGRVGLKMEAKATVDLSRIFISHQRHVPSICIAAYQLVWCYLYFFFRVCDSCLELKPADALGVC